MRRGFTPWPRMGATIYRDMQRRVESAVTIDELRALRRFARRRLAGDERLAALEEMIEQRAMAMIAEAEAAMRESEPKRAGTGASSPPPEAR